MRRHLFAFVFVAVPLSLVIARAQPKTTAVDLTAMDRSVDACTDFYTYACGGWTAQHPLPADRRTFGRFQEVQDRNFAILRRILETPGGTGDLKKARDYYAACTDREAIDNKGLGPLKPEFQRIDALRDKAGLPELVAHLHTIVGEVPAPGATRREGVYVFFQLGSRPRPDDATMQTAGVGPDGTALPGRDYYLNTDDKSVALRKQYRDHIAHMLVLSGTAEGAANGAADAVLKIETTLATGMLDVAARRDPNATNHPMKVADLQQLTPAFDWKRYLAAVRAPAFTDVNVSQPVAMQAVNEVIATTSVDDLKSYLRWHLVHGSSFMLPAAFNDASFDFFSRKLAGQQEPQPRWRECIGDADQELGEALGKAFVDEAFGPAAKADMLKMVRGIKDALHRDIEGLEWMSGETKQAAYAKLAAVEDRIGYPDRWREYRTMEIGRDDALGNRQRATGFANARRLAKIDKPVDRNDWSMTPPTVNAYYSPPSNNINFPAGILQPPFYQAGRDAAVNYGAAGGVIGHELTHGFDDQGRKYDGKGNLRDWWTAGDGKAFEERAQCLVDEYSSFTVAGDTHLNGKLTLGENTGDNGGLRLAVMAYLAGPGATDKETIDGFTPEQRVFMGWAQVWCENSRPEAERLKARTNPHSSNRFRVNGVVSNMPEFQKAFSCKADAPMVRQNACRVW